MNARTTALSALIAVRRQNAWADGALKEYIARDRLSRRDAALAARLVYGVVQNRLLLDFDLAQVVSSPLAKLQPVVLDILRLGAYQILFLDKIPVSAAVNVAVEQTKIYANKRAAGLVNGSLRALARQKDTLAAPQDLATKYSHPQPLVDCLRASMDEETLEAFLAADNDIPKTALQCNPLIAAPEQVASALDEAQRGSVLSHERAHLARRDHWWKPLGFALLAVYWFNPVLWLAYALLCRDIELACDERVIRTMDESAVKTYSTVLLACSMPRKAVITCPLAFGEVGVKERVKNALHYKKPAFWVVAASVAVCVVVAVCFLTNPPTDTDAAGLIGFHRERVTYADVTDENGAQPSNVQLTAEETDAVYALLDTLQYKRLGTASAMQDCYARLYFISAAGERCEVMLSEREMLVNPITGGKTARLYELRSGSTELRDYLLGCIGASDAAEEEMKTLTDPKLGRRLTVPVKWDELAVLAVGGKGIMPPDGDPNAEDYIPLFRLYEKRAYESAPQDEQGYVWNLCAMRTDRFERTYGADAVFSEILGIADYVIGSDDEYVYLLTLPSDVRWLENDPVSYRQYKALQSDSQGVLTRFLKDNGIHINEVCPASSVFSPPARGDAASTTGYTAYDALLAEISDLRRSGASEAQTDFSHDLLSANDYYQTPGWLLRDLDGDGIPELLLGADWGDGHSVIFNIYRLDGAKAVRVVDGWNRSRWYLCTDGSLAHEGSDGASEGTYSYYRYENGALRHLETVISLDGWLYSDTTDHYVGGKGFRSVTEAEATAVMDKYTHETLVFTPFVV